MEILRKSFTGIELKTDKKGSFTARIATLNVIDKDGDVTLPGAFPQGKEILISAYQHESWMGALPVGKGVIREEKDDVFVDGEFNLSTDTGKEHYETVKFAPQLTEWSYGFIIKRLDEESEWNQNPKVYRVLKELDVFEASPVLRGAGENTTTLAIKSEGKTLKEQSSEVLTAINGLLTRLKSLTDLRREQGRNPLSKASKDEIIELDKGIDSVKSEIKTLLCIPQIAGNEEALKVYARFLQIEHEILKGN